MGADSGAQQVAGLSDRRVEGSIQRPVCQICQQQPHKYRCPGCQMHICSLTCSKQHKEQTGCSGKRNKLAFVPMQQFTDKHLMSDYRWLEEVSRADDNARRLRPPTPKRELPPHLSSMVHQAKMRGVRLMIMAPGMQRRQHNSTRYDFRNRKLLWRIEWKFTAAAAAAAAPVQGQQQDSHSAHSPQSTSAAAATNTNCLTIVDGRVDESSLLSDILQKHLEYQPGCGGQALQLRQYKKAAATAALTVLMRHEPCPANRVRYHAINLQQSLRSQLASKTVIEFPTLLVLLPHEAKQYDIITAEELQAEQAVRDAVQQQQRWLAPPPPPPKPAIQQQQQQQANTEEQQQHDDSEAPAAKRHCVGTESAAAIQDVCHAQTYEVDEQPQQQATAAPPPAAALEEQQQQQQGKQPKYFYYDPADGVEDDAADLLGGLAEDGDDTEKEQQQQQQPETLGDDAGKATMMQLLGQYDENEIDID